MKQITATLSRHRQLGGSYHQLDFHAPDIANETQPGQFVHVKLPGLGERILRRPFSIYDADAASGRISIIYKVVGEGTRHLSTVTTPGTLFDLLGPLGHGYTSANADERLVIVAGGYGCAATYLLAKRAPETARPVVLLGGRSAEDILLVDEYRALGCDVRIATNDGTRGTRGFVTALLQDVLNEASGTALRIAACGPNPMLKAVSDMTLPMGIATEISLDHAMCCGVGACFACVVKVKADTETGWAYSRSCVDGPVYDARDVYWE